MTDISIPVALGPHGNPVPIREAERKTDYYVCPECGEFVTPRIGSQRQYFAHKRGVLEDTDCSLSSQADIDQMVDELRTSDIEEGEQKRDIRIHIGEKYDDHVECFGVLPSLEWGNIPPATNVDELLEEITITTEGVSNEPVPQNFHPSEDETVFALDLSADEYLVDIDGPDELSTITGQWSADGLAKGDLFVGDQSRARRHRNNRQIREGEWVYLLTKIAPPSLPDVVETYDADPFTVLAFPARESTEDLLEEHGEVLTTDDYGFDADVVLPPDTHPTIEAPIHGDPAEPVLIGITPAEGIDPIFEVVSIPKHANDTIEIEPNGPGNPRYFPTEIPANGSRRISIHQRNSNRHRLVHLHPESSDQADETQWADESDSRTVGIELDFGNDTEVLSPIGFDGTLQVPDDFDPQALPWALSYIGPDGLEVEVTATFMEDSPLGPALTRFTTEIEDLGPEIAHWIEEGCTTVRFEFGGIGAVSLEFPQPELAVSLDSKSDVQETASSL